MSSPDHFVRAFQALPAPFQSAARKRALDHLIERGLPKRHGEHWKYTDLSSLADFEPSTEVDTDAASSELPEDADGIEALNAAFARGGLNQRIEQTPPSGEVLIAGGSGHRRHRIEVAQQVEVRIRLDQQQDADFQSVILDLHLHPGAQVRLLRAQDAAANARHFTRIRAFLARDSSLEIASLDFGGRLSRHDLDVRLEGPGASVQLVSLFHADHQGHIDNQVRFDHLAPSCISRQWVRGLAGERSRGIFNGKVVVHPGAQKTDSEQRLAHLLLSPRSEINAKPELEIYADDVKCAHGATFGQLDEVALFYLRSRGLPEVAARAVLTQAFALDPLRRITDADFRAQALQLASARIGAGVEALPT